jgi:hypothetical protein
MTTQEAIQLATEAIEFRIRRLQSEDRYYTAGDGARHDAYIEQIARLEEASRRLSLHAVFANA